MCFTNRGTMFEAAERAALEQATLVRLSADAFAKARAAAPGWYVYALEQEWCAWMADGGLDAPRSADKAFVGFCRRWYEKRGAP